MGKIKKILSNPLDKIVRFFKMAENTGKVKKNIKESWFNIKFDVDKPWLQLINDQLKWSFLFFTKSLSYIGAIIFIVTLVRFTGIIKNVRNLVEEEVFGIVQQKISLVSSPNITHKGALKETSDIIKMLESKKSKKNKGTKTNEEKKKNNLKKPIPNNK